MGFYDQLAKVRANAAARQAADAAAHPYGTVSAVQGAQDAQIDRERGYGNTASDAYLSRAMNFDASAALNKYASGAYNTISQGLKRTLSDLGGAAVGAGRFDSGFYDEDQGVVINNATQQLNDAIAGQSMNALSAQQRNDEGLGSFGQRATEDANDLLMSRSEQVQNDARDAAERARKRKRGIGAAIGATLGGVGGFLTGGPAGAIGGAKAGAQIGGGF